MSGIGRGTLLVMDSAPSRSVVSMVRWLALSAAVCALAACGSSSAATSAGTAAVNCGPSADHTVARSSQARVYAAGHSLYGCTGGANHPILLGSTTGCIRGASVGEVAVAGRLAAYAVRRCGVDTSSSQVVVRRLTDGRQLSARDAFHGQPGPESFQSVSAVVVSASGAAAWIVSSSSIATHKHSSEVVAATAGSLRVLDSGTGTAFGSLRLSHGTLSWTRDGVRHTAALS
jgi:hypothetical protein